MSIPNRFDIVQAVNAAHPTLIARNTRETVTEFLWRVVWALSQTDANFGFLSKSPAENGTEIPGAGRVALDALCYKGQHNSVDIVGSASDGPGTGSIGWSEDEHRRPSNQWVQAVPYPDGSTQPPDEVPPPSHDLEALIRRVEALEANAVQYGQRLALRAHRGQLLCAENGGPEHDHEPFDLTSRDHVGSWESWKIERGQ